MTVLPKTKKTTQAPAFLRLDELQKVLVGQGRTEKTQKAYRRFLSYFGEWIVRNQGTDVFPTEEMARDFLRSIEPKYAPATLRNITQALSYWSKVFAPPGWFVDEAGTTDVEEDLPPDLAAFASWLKETTRAPKTVRAYLQRVRQFQRWWAGREGREFEVSFWMPLDTANYVDDLMETAKPSTVNLAIAALTRYAEWAIKQGRLVTNPVENPGQLMVPGEVSTPKWLSRDDDERLAHDLLSRTQAESADTPWKLSMAVRDWAIYQLMRAAGLRISEVSSLKLDHVNMDAMTIVVQFSKWNRSRVVPLTKTVKDALAWWLRVRGEFPSPYMFVSQHNTQLKNRTIQGRAAEWKQANNLPEWFTAQWLRHAYGRSLAGEGMDPAKVALLMGYLKPDGKPNLDAVAPYFETKSTTGSPPGQ